MNDYHLLITMFKYFAKYFTARNPSSGQIKILKIVSIE